MDFKVVILKYLYSQHRNSKYNVIQQQTVLKQLLEQKHNRGTSGVLVSSARKQNDKTSVNNNWIWFHAAHNQDAVKAGVGFHAEELDMLQRVAWTAPSSTSINHGN